MSKIRIDDEGITITSGPAVADLPPGKTEIVLKWDLGEGDEDAILVRGRDEIASPIRTRTALDKATTEKNEALALAKNTFGLLEDSLAKERRMTSAIIDVNNMLARVAPDLRKSPEMTALLESYRS